ncbi:MAG: MFS transporter [Mycobacterium sp.]|nr:MFS transporter [Mycobacterium sp.]
MTGAAEGSGSWRELLGRAHLGTTIILAGGVAMYATNEFITMSLLPNLTTDIGGARLYAWVTTVYLVASVVAATTVGSLLTRFGPRRSYLGALLGFALATGGCSLAPSMPALLAGRIAQGLAGGVLAGLGYAVISAALPERLWTRASAAVSAMWGVGTLVGPAIGGLFAQIGWWRGGFAALAILTALIAALVPFALPVRGQGSPLRTRIPIVSLTILGAAALLVAAAAIQTGPMAAITLLVCAALLVGGFVLVDRGSAVRVLPRATFGPGPLKWIYLTLGVLMAATMVDLYAPLFGQRLGSLPPAAAGFLGAALSVGWTAGEIRSAGINDRRTAARVVTWAPLVMATGLGLSALVQQADAGPGVVAVWALALVVSGTGIGMAWPHLCVWAMGLPDESDEQAVAAAAINTVQLISGAFGAGLAGVVVNMRETPDTTAARWLFALFAALAATGWAAASRAVRPAE